MKQLKAYIERQKTWSQQTFGDGERTVGLCKHIAKELEEIKTDPHDIYEWVDVIILALDGAWRHGFTSDDIARALHDKQQINFTRAWPEPNGQDEPTEHIRG